MLALIGFFIAVEKRSVASQELPIRWPWYVWTLIAWAAMGLGVLTKGPVAFAVPLLVAAPYAIWRRASLAVWHPLGPAVMLGLALPWVWAVSREIPNFLHYVVVTETWARMTTDELRRTEPVWFFVPVLLAGTFPWSIVALSNLRSRWALEEPFDRRLRIYLLLWLVVPLIFFSLSRGKQEQYMLPLVPAVALLVASRWTGRPRGVRVAAVIWGVLGLAMVTVAALGVPGLDTDRVSDGDRRTDRDRFRCRGVGRCRCRLVWHHAAAPARGDWSCAAADGLSGGHRRVDGVGGGRPFSAGAGGRD